MPKLTNEQNKQLRELARRPDSDIDLSDISEIKSLPPDAIIGKYYRPKKVSVTIRLDADLVAWLKASGAGYQTRINSHLRRLMARKKSH